VDNIKRRPSVRGIISDVFTFLDTFHKLRPASKSEALRIVSSSDSACQWSLSFDSCQPESSKRTFALSIWGVPNSGTEQLDFDIQRIQFAGEVESNGASASTLTLPTSVPEKRDAITVLVERVTKLSIAPLVAQQAKLSAATAKVFIHSAANALQEECPEFQLQKITVTFGHKGSNSTWKFSDDFGTMKMDRRQSQPLQNNMVRRAFIALGSNIGDRFAMIEWACKEMENAGITIARTSGLWETKAMYVENQDNFLNGVCEVGNHHSGPMRIPFNELFVSRSIRR
jgi:hypothetical protein